MGELEYLKNEAMYPDAKERRLEREARREAVKEAARATAGMLKADADSPGATPAGAAGPTPPY